MNRRLQEFGQRYLVPLLVCSVVITQQFFLATSEMSTWKGSGFGMFGTIDSPRERFIAAEGILEDGTHVNLDITDALEESYSRLYWSVRCRLTSAKLNSIAAIVGNGAYDLEEGPPPVAAYLQRLEHRDGDDALEAYDDQLRRPLYKFWQGDARLKSARVRLWKLTFDPEEEFIWVNPVGEAASYDFTS
ncbi:MAG: hypothetical protein Q8R76_09110 [Candidatus Omnitrophota bacterium]|nr:hypothetical protein [Candidatus Omnitrophota bacterium]